MRYVSTRGEATALAFDEVLLTGLARDGGLYVPESWPQFEPEEIAELKDLNYAETAFRVIRPFVGGAVADADLRRLLEVSYSVFDRPEVAPLKRIGDGDYLLELFHGPTLAFKDVAMQFLGNIFDHVLKARGERVTIVGATSGDTGSAAIEACRDRDALDVFILYPNGRVSEVQRRQMTTVAAANVHALAVDGTFDDCQDLVKAMFNDAAFRDRWNLSAVNSINWARVVAQIVYYFYAAVRLGAPDTAVSFAVPTGNFGNVFAGYAAHRMGLPVERLVIGSNRNDILTRFFETGTMRIGEVYSTISPSMDIQVSSNFERLLFELLERDGARVKTVLEKFRTAGRFTIEPERLQRALAIFDAARFDDDETRAVIGSVRAACGETLDPHSAVGMAAAQARRGDTNTPMVVLATAHPGKFPDAVEQATGERPRLPDHMADLLAREERVARLENDLDAVQSYISDRLEAAA